ncbi:MAG TPA: DUF4334 domain-containing protein [Leptolyngbyaceae cyanobacterium M65_K2018_010]|nr:DUF4334 domain-containing protein [Leptolyngbyaceae cyanobacterium M65_K2018_010]
MDVLDHPHALLEATQTTPEQVLNLFDRLEAVDLDFMTGRWRGSELAIGHPLDGFLKASNWYGKEFIDPETVHPILVLDPQGHPIKVAPNHQVILWALKFPELKNLALQPLLTGLSALMQTEKSQARLRMMDYRGKVSATMIYDYLPINDVFRKVDDNTVLGVMDFKTIPQPFFFVLRRDR